MHHVNAHLEVKETGLSE